MHKFEGLRKSCIAYSKHFWYISDLKCAESWSASWAMHLVCIAHMNSTAYQYCAFCRSYLACMHDLCSCGLELGQANCKGKLTKFLIGNITLLVCWVEQLPFLQWRQLSRLSTFEFSTWWVLPVMTAATAIITWMYCSGMQLSLQCALLHAAVHRCASCWARHKQAVVNTEKHACSWILKSMLHSTPLHCSWNSHQKQVMLRGVAAGLPETCIPPSWLLGTSGTGPESSHASLATQSSPLNIDPLPANTDCRKWVMQHLMTCMVIYFTVKSQQAQAVCLACCICHHCVLLYDWGHLCYCTAWLRWLFAECRHMPSCKCTLICSTLGLIWARQANSMIITLQHALTPQLKRIPHIHHNVPWHMHISWCALYSLMYLC